LNESTVGGDEYRVLRAVAVRERRAMKSMQSESAMRMPRRQFLRLAAAAALPGAMRLWDDAQAATDLGDLPAPTRAEQGAMADLARAFMQKYAAPALSIAIGHADKLVYEEAFGWADRERREAVSPQHLFRIASVSKPITSVAIFSLVEAGRIGLSDRVFGPGGITGTDYGRQPYHPHVEEITVEHLLTHTCGGWSNHGADPMFMNRDMNHAELIAWTLRNRPLDHPPGQNHAYSNFGYCVLGRVIEKITKQPYAAYVGGTVLKRCGIDDMAIAGNTLGQRHAREVKYYGQGEDPYGMNVKRMDSHGGWIAQPVDLVRIFAHVSAFSPPANILRPQTIQVMTTASAANAGYAKGWAVNKAGNWWHNGSLPGTSTIAVRTHSGFCWAAFTNTRKGNSSLGGDLDRLVWAMVKEVKAWRA
jgi:CubicO group peptidase (beta-lactamase class C family)